MNPAVWLERHGRRLANLPAVAEGERVHATWSQFASTAAALAAGLRNTFGLAPGDRVAIVMRNRPEYLEALFAAWHAGLVAVPVNARLHREEIAYILDHSGASVVITDEEHADDVEPLVHTVESVKAASDVYAPLAGEVLAINDTLAGEPQAVNAQPYTGGWLFTLRPADPNAVAALLNATDYDNGPGA